MFKSAILTLLVVSLTAAASSAEAQRGADRRAGPSTRGGQDLSTMGGEPPATGRPAQGFEAERLARARRQAEFSHDFPGTPVRPFAGAPSPRSPGGRPNGAL